MTICDAYIPRITLPHHNFAQYQT